MAPSSMMVEEPMRMGPEMANMEAFGWMIVEGPIVISPFSSTSWQMIALEWIVYLSLLQAEWVGLDWVRW